MTGCWCGGDLAGYHKHTQRAKKTEPCTESRLANTLYHRAWVERNREHVREYDRTHVRGWKPGSEIDLSDDQL